MFLHLVGSALSTFTSDEDYKVHLYPETKTTEETKQDKCLPHVHSLFYIRINTLPFNMYCGGTTL